ncbi:MAG TPA: ABC transporter permease [Clostridiales bacterium]|nr:MAG: FtsX-like permease family protein [Firmicutes bacterium ADurb.Bin262]HOU09219.1 ABC transporter permease [Clostridiales bacterium]
MYVFKNAWKSITRSPGRNIIIGVIVMAIAVSGSIALSIRRAASKAEQEGLEALNITAQITVDRQKMMQAAREQGGDMREALQGAQELSIEQLQTYAEAESVEDFYYSVNSSFDAGTGLSPVDTSSEEDDSSDTQPDMPGSMPPGGDMRGGMGEQGDFRVTGFSSYDDMTDFANSTAEITGGEVFDIDSADADCIVSEELAQLNGLEVGDTIELANPNASDETYTFTICGIYSYTGSDTSGQMIFSASQDPANRIYTSSAALLAVIGQSESVAQTSTDEETGLTKTTALRKSVSGTYVFADAASYETFQTQVTAMGLPDTYRVTSSDLTQYEDSLAPLKKLSMFASYFVLIVLLIGGTILVAFNIYNIRERKYEVGVLTAVGMKKRKVALQFVSEIFLVTLASIIIGTAAGAASSVPVANKLLAAQVTSAQEDTSNTGDFGGRLGMPAGDQSPPDQGGPGGFRGRVVDYVSSVNASADMVVVAELMGIGVLLTILSSLAALVFILRYEPLKILSNRT